MTWCQSVFEGDYLLFESQRAVPAFDVTPDGKRFLMIRRAREAAGRFGLVIAWSRHVQERSRASR